MACPVCRALSCLKVQILPDNLCVWWTKAVINCCYFKNKVILTRNYYVFKMWLTFFSNPVLSPTVLYLQRWYDLCSLSKDIEQSICQWTDANDAVENTLKYIRELTRDANRRYVAVCKLGETDIDVAILRALTRGMRSVLGAIAFMGAHRKEERRYRYR